MKRLGSTLCSIILGLSTLAASDGRAHAEPPAELLASGAPTAEGLGRYAAQLGSSDATARTQAFNALTELGHDALPALRARLTALSTVRPTHDEALRVLSVFRRAAGSHRADDETDLARGVLNALTRERSPAMIAMAEPLLLLRAIESADDTEMQLELARYVTLDEGAWLNELALARKRRGNVLLPTWIMLRSHESPDVRRFAQAQVAALGMAEPKDALAIDDPYLLARVIAAYANPPEYAAMPLVTRMAGDERIEVREAARAMLARFGKNAIWQVRELYEEVSGQVADKSWGFEETSRELYTVLDRPALEDAATLLARGRKALESHDLASVSRDYDTLLAKYPDFAERAELAPGYAAIGAARFADDELEAALAAYRRAARLAPNAPESASYRAQVEYVSAELALSQGVVDLASYARAVALDPSLRAARDALDRLSGEKTRRVRATKRWAAAAALALVLALAAFALRSRKQAPVDANADPALEA